MYNTQLKLFTNNWAVNSGFEHLQKQLEAMLPVMGKVEKSQSANTSNLKSLEKHRIYYTISLTMLLETGEQNLETFLVSFHFQDMVISIQSVK